jgi:hypothetical protein
MTMWFVVRKRNKRRTPIPSRPVINPKRYLQHLSMCVYRTKIRQSYSLSDSCTNLQEIVVEVPLSNFNCYDSCYNTNMANDICFQSLHLSIWETN